jgi:hypothetical protein
MSGFIPRKVDPFPVRVVGGRFKGARGTVTDVHEDGVFGIDVDGGGRAFAKEDEFLRVETDPEKTGPVNDTLRRVMARSNKEE